MKLTKLYLQDFRRFTQQTWSFSPEITVIYAPNGQGKTTILEAINLLATGKSWRVSKTNELLRFGQEIARAYGLLDDDLKLGITFTGGQVGGKRTATKLFALNSAKKRSQDFVGNLLVACFRPEDLRLIEGSPARRRDYLDSPLELVSDRYRQARRQYQATLLRRNKLLQAIRDGEATADSLPYWDNNLLIYGEIIHQWRQDYLDFVNQQLAPLPDLKIIYDHSTVTPERLKKYQVAEQAVGYSLIGPHKDDFYLRANFHGVDESLMTYGSRGQHRLAVLWLKMAELAWLAGRTDQQPILLLDDIFSELDEQAAQTVRQLATQQQTIITTTDKKVVELFTPVAQVIELSK